MDFTKLVDLLETRTLHFQRLDSFDDPFEGSVSEASGPLLKQRLHKDFGTRPTVWKREDIDTLVELELLTISNSDSTFANCWHASSHESAAMWRLYLKSPEGVAVRTKVHRVAKALAAVPMNVYISKVKYIDFRKGSNDDDPAIYKRLSFSHEREVRLLIERGHRKSGPISTANRFIKLPIDLCALVESIVVCPTADRWFGELVEKVVSRYGLHVKVERSNLYDRPTN